MLCNIPAAGQFGSLVGMCQLPVFYEWAIARSGQSGVAATQVHAMDALALALLELGRGDGLVRPIELMHNGRCWGYVRFPTTQWATCLGDVVLWDAGSNCRGR